MKLTDILAKNRWFFEGQSVVPFAELKDSCVLVTGATGLIGKTFVHYLLAANRKLDLGLTVVAVVRDADKAHALLGAESSSLRFVVGTMEAFPDVSERVDYIVHAASQTASRMMVECPVETIATALSGTQAVLELARKKQCRGVVYLSSMEVYGSPLKGDTVGEDYKSRVSPLSARSSYPVSKMMCENLCVAYAAEYGVRVMIARPAQTFGPGIAKEDSRVYAQLARCALSKETFVMKSMGESERPCLYTLDAATAIATILLRGTPGEAYNVANVATYCSVLDMAKLVGSKYGFEVAVEIPESGVSCYPETFYMNLDTHKLESLGWRPTCDLIGMFERMLCAMRGD